MKKTFITVALLAASQSAFAILDYPNIFDLPNWQTGVGSGREGRPTFVISDGLASLNSSNWSQARAEISGLGIAVSDTTAAKSIDFSFSMNIGKKDSNFNVAIGTLVIGSPYYNAGGGKTTNPIVVSTTSNASASFISHETGGFDTTNAQTLVATPVFDNQTTWYTISGHIEWGTLNDTEQYIATVSCGDTSVQVGLGASFSADRVLLSGDGANSTYNGTFKDFSLIPEPATATLSLLALSGLCARRRRK